MKEFESPNRQLRKAIRKSHQFHTMMTAFFKSDYRSTVVERDEKTGCDLHKVKIVKFPSDDMTDVVYDAIDAYRSTLDHTAYACAVLSGVSGKPLEAIAYPISRDPKKIESSIGSGCQGVHPDIVDLFRSHKAYPGGNDALAKLNLIRRQGHHRIILPVGAIASVEPGLASMSRKRPRYIPGPIWDRKKHEIVFRSVDPHGGEFGYDAKVTFDIAFGEVDAVAGELVWPFLIKTAEAVDRVVKETEAKAQSIWGE
jgi:hypothetical protein